MGYGSTSDSSRTLYEEALLKSVEYPYTYYCPSIGIAFGWKKTWKKVLEWSKIAVWAGIAIVVGFAGLPDQFKKLCISKFIDL